MASSRNGCSKGCRASARYLFKIDGFDKSVASAKENNWCDVEFAKRFFYLFQVFLMRAPKIPTQFPPVHLLRAEKDRIFRGAFILQELDCQVYPVGVAVGDHFGKTMVGSCVAACELLGVR